MNNLMKYQITLDKLSEVLPLLNADAQSELKAVSNDFINEVQESQYIKVPLVGVFSAGKSSLLNVFTQKPGMLPVDTLPETAVAYELYYGENECVELYRDGSKIDSKPLADIKSLVTSPGDIAKVYCTSEPIKALQTKGIILVDMPGIGSGIERHDAAIFNYINSGTAFVLVVDAEQGSLRGSTLTFMQELATYGLYPAVLVSKIDKKTEKELGDIIEYIQYQLTQTGNSNPFVSTVCAVNNNIDGLVTYLETLNAEALVAEKYGKKLKAIINSVIDQLKIRVDLRTKDIADADEKLKKIEEEIENVKAELPQDNSTADTPEKSTQDILDNVRAALEAKADDIAQMVMNREDKDSIMSAIVSIVRSEIISSMKDESEQYSMALSASVQEAVKNLATIEISKDFISDWDDLLATVSGVILKFVKAGGIWGKIASYILPVLPNILNWLFGKSDSEVLAEIREKVLSKCIDPIIRDLRPTIYKMIVDNQKIIQERIQAELVSKMEKVKEGLREKMADANKSKEEVQSELNVLGDAINKLNILVESI